MEIKDIHILIDEKGNILDIILYNEKYSFSMRLSTKQNLKNFKAKLLNEEEKEKLKKLLDVKKIRKAIAKAYKNLKEKGEEALPI